jgi:hypothetical protein
MRVVWVPVAVAACAVLAVTGCVDARKPRPPPHHDLTLQMAVGPHGATTIATVVGSAVIPLGVVGVPNQVTGVDAASITVTLFPDDERLCLVEWRDLFADASHADLHQFFRVVRLDHPREALLAGDWQIAASGDAAGARTITRADGAQVPLALSISGTCQVLHKTGWIGLVRGAEVRALRPDDAQAPAALIDAYRLISWYQIGDDRCRHESSSFVDLIAGPAGTGRGAIAVVGGHPWLKFGAPVAHDPAWFNLAAEPPLTGDHPCVDTGVP